MSDNVLIWDSAGPPPNHEGTIVLWRRIASNKSSTEVSIPAFIEENADFIKARYLAWIYDLGQAKYQNLKVSEALKIRKNLSYWWMTPLAEKSNYSKSPQITDAIRLIAFDVWASNRTIIEVEFLSSNKELLRSLQEWCTKQNIDFKFRKIPKQVIRISFRRRLFTLLPSPVQALIVFFLYLTDRWQLRKVGMSEWRESNAKLSFISYLFNLAPNTIENGSFRSPYWANLPDELDGLNKKSNWLHIYIKDSNLPKSIDAANFIRKINSTSTYQVHVTLDSFLSIRVILKTLNEWIKLRSVMNKLNDVLECVSSGDLNLWPLYAKEWSASASGPSLIQNLLILNLFDSAMAHLPEQSVGTYLFEQQPWEMALISAWKASEHKTLVAAQHTTMLFWDLRYFHNFRSYEIEGDSSLPLPDVFAVNGPLAMKMCQAWGYPRSRLVEVEALRYLHLLPLQQPSSQNSASKKPFKLLVLGDYLQNNTDLQMKLLESAIPFLPKGIQIIIKPHPNCPISASRFKINRLTINEAPIAQLVRKCDAAFSSTTTSAVLDAYCLGLPVISMRNFNELNLSPLRGIRDVAFISTPRELALKVTELMSSQTYKSIPADIFILDANLMRWKKLLL